MKAKVGRADVWGARVLDSGDDEFGAVGAVNCPETEAPRSEDENCKKKESVKIETSVFNDVGNDNTCEGSFDCSGTDVVNGCEGTCTS